MSTPAALSTTGEVSKVQGDDFYLHGSFDDTMRATILVPLSQRVRELALSRAESRVTLHVSSNGGSGLLMWDIVELVELAKRNGVTVRTVVASHAYSAGSIVAVAGTPGERFIGRNATHLAHYGSIGWYAKSPLQADRDHEHMKQWFAGILAHYKRHTKIPRLTGQMMDDGFWIPAGQCIEWSLADAYIDAMPVT